MEQVCEQKVVCEYSSLQLTMFGLDFFLLLFYHSRIARLGSYVVPSLRVSV